MTISFTPLLTFQTNNVEELEQGINFLHELAGYFFELKDRDYIRIKHHIAGVLVEILAPVASVGYRNN